MQSIIYNFLKQKIDLLYISCISLIVLSSLFDGVFYWGAENQIYKISNLALAAIGFISILFLFNKSVSRKLLFLIVTYSTLINIYFIFLTQTVEIDYIFHLFRDTLILPIYLVALGVLANKIHIIISGTSYFLFVVLVIIKTRNEYLMDNIVFLFIVLISTTIGIYLFFGVLHETFIKNEDMRDALTQKNKLLLAQKQNLELLNDFKNHILSVISHDLKNEIGGIKLAMDFLIKNKDSINDELRDKYDVNLYYSADQSYNLMQNLLEWAKINRNNIVFQPSRVLLSEIVEKSCENLWKQAEAKHIKIVKNNLDIFIDVDFYSISAAIRNLLHNAIKFTNRNGEIKIGATLKDKIVTVIIEDNGVGITASLKAMLFEPSRQISTLGTSKEQGSGLGLIMSRDFILKNNGIISIESEVGKGTKVIISLPGGE